MFEIIPRYENSHHSILHIDHFIRDKIELSTFMLNNDDILFKLKSQCNRLFMIFAKNGEMIPVRSSKNKTFN